MPTPQAAPALARYLKQQAANRLSVQQRGVALREAEQEARSRTAAEAPRVLNQLEAEARLKVRSIRQPPGAFPAGYCYNICQAFAGTAKKQGYSN
jgi:GH35 family endo-1,4-beta-xylanase